MICNLMGLIRDCFVFSLCNNRLIGCRKGLVQSAMLFIREANFVTSFFLSCAPSICKKGSALKGKSLSFILLNPDISCFANSVDPDQLASVCYQVCKFIAIIWIKQPDWLKIRCGILIYSAGQELRVDPFSEGRQIFWQNCLPWKSIHSP